jgi:hypothetical protein
MAVKYKIVRVSVESTEKGWGEAKALGEGYSCGTQFTMDAVPEEGAWSLYEAKKVCFSLKKELYKMLRAESQVRGIKPPKGTDSTEQDYEKILKVCDELIEEDSKNG